MKSGQLPTLMTLLCGSQYLLFFLKPQFQKNIIWAFISHSLGKKYKEKKEFILVLVNVEKARIYVLSVPKCAKSWDSMEKNPQYINSHYF